jgi:hypothetical protein
VRPPGGDADGGNVRLRPLLALPVLVCVAILAGCSADGRAALTLLEQADAAQKQVRSATFVVRFSMTADGKAASLVLTGGAYVQGPRAGDASFRLTSEGLPQQLDLSVVERDHVLTMIVNGSETRLPAASSQGSTTGEALASQLARLDLEQYVKSVSVEHGAPLDGVAYDKIVGVIDTGKLVDGVLAGLGNLASAGSGLGLPGGTSSFVGETRAVLYLSETTHLLKVALLQLHFKNPAGAGAKPIDLNVSYALTGVDGPVAGLSA